MRTATQTPRQPAAPAGLLAAASLLPALLAVLAVSTGAEAHTPYPATRPHPAQAFRPLMAPGLWADYRQRDRPGDYRCDAFWNANREDCGARWRDQRPHGSYARQPYRRGYPGYIYGVSHDVGPSVFPGAYGRPDLVYPGTGHASPYGGAGYGYGRDPQRIAWCRASYRSYDPATGYYRAYSGFLTYCG